MLSQISNELNVNHPIKILKKGKLFENLSEHLYNVEQSQDILFFDHKRAVLTDTFENTPALNKFFRVLATAKNSDGQEFVATVEAIKYPIFATQFHAEKN